MPLTKEGRKIISEAAKRAWSAGSFENRLHHPNSIGTRRGTLTRSHLCARGVSHFQAVHFCFLSPAGVIYKGRNIRDFVRNNASIFPRESVKWLPKYGESQPHRDSCHALVGLHNVHAGHYAQWRGWRLADQPKGD